MSQRNQRMTSSEQKVAKRPKEVLHKEPFLKALYLYLFWQAILAFQIRFNFKEQGYGKTVAVPSSLGVRRQHCIVLFALSPKSNLSSILSRDAAFVR